MFFFGVAADQIRKISVIQRFIHYSVSLQFISSELSHLVISEYNEREQSFRNVLEYT